MLDHYIIGSKIDDGLFVTQRRGGIISPLTAAPLFRLGRRGLHYRSRRSRCFYWIPTVYGLVRSLARCVPYWSAGVAPVVDKQLRTAT